MVLRRRGPGAYPWHPPLPGASKLPLTGHRHRHHRSAERGLPGTPGDASPAPLRSNRAARQADHRRIRAAPAHGPWTST